MHTTDLAAPTFAVTVDGQAVTARVGQTVAALLLACGIRTFRHTAVHAAPRGLFCGIGICYDCLVTVDGQPNVRACLTPVADGMAIDTRGAEGGDHDAAR